MLITNGSVTRNISPSRLAEYARKGYTEVKTPKAEKAPEKGDKTATKTNAKKKA